MSVAFRKSLFGFNCDDVIDYVDKARDIFHEKTIELEEKTEQYEKDIVELKSQLETALSEKIVYETELKKLLEKQQNIEEISEKIGKLFLVAKANANAIVSNAEKSREIVQTEIETNLDTIEKALELLNDAKQKVNENSETFSSNVDNVSESLEVAKDSILTRTVNSKERYESWNNFSSKI